MNWNIDVLDAAAELEEHKEFFAERGISPYERLTGFLNNPGAFAHVRFPKSE